MRKKIWRILGSAFVLVLFLFWTLRTAAAASSSVAASGDAYMLAKLISGEARGESFIGQVAVGAVVMNRLQNPSFPNSLSGVVFEPGAFDAVGDGQYHKEPTTSAVQAAQSALAGWDPTGGALYYWNPISATSDWVWSRSIIARIGRHVFAR
jgi:N-acetylmuramoyl-L-alanine amidase